MTDLGKTLLKQLRDREEFKPLMRELQTLRPIVPRYKPSDDALLIERIKYETARQDGFDFLMMYLTGERNG